MLDDRTLSAVAPAVELRDLRKNFDALEVLRGINLSVQPGTTTCLLGPSGSGKSTLLRCINWLEKPSAGEVYIHGAQVGRRLRRGKDSAMTERELTRMRTRISMVFQQFNLWPHMTVLENVTEAPIQVQKRNKVEVAEEAEKILTKVGLADKKDVYPARLSGGQKQRVAIARALAMNSEVILFDEPTSALDPELVGEVLAVIKALSEEGMTMMIATHEMQFAAEVADQIVFMDAGNVVEVAPPQRFFSAPETDRAKRFLERYSTGFGIRSSVSSAAIA